MATKKETPKKPAAKKAAATKKTATAKKTVAKKVEKIVEQTAPEHIGLVRNDSWLEPFEGAIRGRHDHALWKIGQLTQNGKKKLSDFASGHLYFGLHKLPKGWVFREWAPNATDIYLIGDFNDWKEDEKYRCKRIEGTGNWELKLSEKALKHGQLYKMKVKWNGGEGERIPAWCRRVVQDDNTKIFSAQVWNPEKKYEFKKKNFKPKKSPLLIYECHVGMAQDAEKVGTYTEFKEKILPRVAKDGYNAIQVMAIQEHPYYGSFGQFFYPGDRHEHPAWDSLCFDYGKDDVLHFLLSNCKYWLEEFKFDGFRFDGVTSMLYYSHGLGEAFGGYGDYFNGHEDDNAICYLTLANCLIHEVNPDAITIAEEVSGMPGLAAKFEDGGYGFDYRMAMNIPDYWIKTIKEVRDEDINVCSIFWEVKNRRPDEKTISYCESHDQALVGDKTIIFRLIDADMYWHFAKKDVNDMAQRGIALHKMIRLVTAAAINGGYLNFMGNEFGHPEWIDFPREGNGWSYKYARRQWNLVDNKDLCYHWLGDFDREMLKTIKSVRNFQDKPVVEIWHDDGDQVLCFMRGDLVFVFNFSPTRSYTDYGFLVPTGSYEVVLNTDSKDFGGNGFADDTMTHLTNYDPLYVKDHKEWLKLYIPARSAVVLKKV